MSKDSLQKLKRKADNLSKTLWRLKITLQTPEMVELEQSNDQLRIALMEAIKQES